MEILNLGDFIVNNYIISTENGYILIDTGYEEGYQQFSHKLKQNNIDLNEIKYLFLTHAHDDHAGFLNELLGHNPNMKVILHQRAIERLRMGQNSFKGGCSNKLAYVFCKFMELLGKGKHKFPSINNHFEKNYIVYGTEEAKNLENELSIKILETPGHTECSISLLYANSLFCGDAAMSGIPSWNNITIWVENLSDFESTWEKIIEINPEIIYVGHGRQIKTKDLIKNISKISRRKLLPLKGN
ncbi:MAG: MBL fold metallo-hydrolase [Tissierellia bacterium]|nr:MBL fold metallo-hydrolase [Tissierellia bacterium]